MLNLKEKSIFVSFSSLLSCLLILGLRYNVIFFLAFYQWVPFCLLVQAILFYLPHLIWHTLSNCSFGDNLSYLITRAKTAAVTEDALSRAKLVRACADQLYLLSRQHFNTSTSPWSKFQECLCANRTCGHSCTVEKRMCNHSALYYLLVKVLYILNCIAQVFLAVCLLGQDVSALNALTGFSELLTGQDYGTRLFPHTGRCTVRVPSVVVQSQSYLATCALPVNVLNEKIYLFLWVWTLAVLTLSVGTTLTWIWRLLMRSHRNSFMRSFLYVSLLTPPSFQASEAADLDIMSGSGACQAASLDGALVERFLTEVVGCDGNFMIRMLRLNAGSIVTGEILVTWWRMFKAIESAEDEGEVVEFEPANPQARTFAEMNELGDPLDRMVRRTMSYI